jgi:hypothetical protein
MAATWWAADAAVTNSTGHASPPPPSPAGPAHISMPAVLASAALVGADAVVSWSLGLGVHWWLLAGVVR